MYYCFTDYKFVTHENVSQYNNLLYTEITRLIRKNPPKYYFSYAMRERCPRLARYSQKISGSLEPTRQ